MEINKIGFEHRHNAAYCIDRPEGSGDYLFLLLKSDTAIMINGEEQNAEAGSFILFTIGTPQIYHAVGSESIYDWFHFSMNNKEFEWLIHLNIPFDRITHIEDVGNLSLLIKNMCHEKYSGTLYMTEILDHYTKLFFLKLSEMLYEKPVMAVTDLHDKMSIIRNQIYNSPQSEWKVENLAHQLTMSRSYFEHKYTEIFGISIINDVITARLERAKYMLTKTDLTVNRIAESCGYNSNTHFMRQFSARTHMTPSEYRALYSATAEDSDKCTGGQPE